MLAQAGALAGELLRLSTTAFEGKTGYGLSRDGEARAARLGRELAARGPAHALTGLFAHAVPPGYTARTWMDEATALARECDVDALDIFVESVAFENDDLALGHGGRGARSAAARAHVERLSTHRSVPVALDHGARSVDHLSCLHPYDVEPLAARQVRGGAAAGGGVPQPRARAARPGARRRRGDLRPADRLQPGHLARDPRCR